jgi:hypothetical protein
MKLKGIYGKIWERSMEFHMEFTPYPMNHGMSWLGKMPSIGYE